MADIRQLETALVNADKAGDTAAARVLANALKTARVAQMPSMDPTEGMGGGQKFLSGVGKGMTDVARGIGQVTGLVPQANIDEAKRLDAPLMNTGAGMAGSIAGNIAATAPTMLIPGAGAVRGAAAIGAGQGALAPVASDESRLANVALGAAGGAGGVLASKGLARVAQPLTGSPAAREMLKKGVVPTPGQASGPASIVNKVEQQLESFGPVGWLISGARGRAVKEMNVEAIKKALPTDEALKAGAPAIARAGDLLDSAYNSAYQSITGKVSVDDAFQAAIKKLPKAEGIDLPPSLEKRFTKLISDRVNARMKDGATAETVRDVHNSLGALARKYRSSADPDQRALGAAFAEAKGSFRELVSRQSSGEFKTAMGALDKKYTALLAIEKAAERAGSKEGVFSAEALRGAAKKSGTEMREFSKTAADVFGRTVPDSGTAGRAFWPAAAYALGGGGAAANEQLGGPGWLTAAALAPLAYSRLGSRYLLGDFAGQAATAKALRATSPYMGQVGRSLLLGKD